MNTATREPFDQELLALGVSRLLHQDQTVTRNLGIPVKVVRSRATHEKHSPVPRREGV
jgi:hypothetical protein